jgi:hypothetical protein
LIVKRAPISFSATHRADGSLFPITGELAKGTLRALIREAGLTKEQFADLL